MTILKAIILPVLIVVALPALTADLEKQRELFLQAEKAFNEKRLDEFQKIKASLTGYPLLPYLEYMELSKNLDETAPEKIRAYLKKYDNTPSEIRLRWTLLFHLAKNKRWKEFLDYYEENRNTELQCHRITALLHISEKKKAHKLAPTLWLSGRSLPDACNPAFDNLKEVGKLTPELVWKRMDLIRSLRGRQRLSLMRYMRKLLPKEEHGYHDLWIYSLRSPEKVFDSPLLNKKHISRGNLLVHALSRMVWRNRDAALKAWDKYKKRGWLSASQQKRVEKAIGFALSRRDHPRATAFLDRIEHCSQMRGLCEVRIRHALKNRKWNKVIDWIDDLPQKEQQHEKWGYWKARALEETGKKAEAKKLFETVAKDRSYHGFLAADKVDAPYRFGHQGIKVGAKELDEMAAMPGFKRAYELYRLEHRYQARREWRWMTRNFDDKGLKTAAMLAKKWGWSERAIFTLLPTQYWDDLEIRFPLEHRKLIESQARKYGINPAWIFAILRQESTFVTEAQSPAGALGLMQLMPSTARKVAKQLKMKRPGREAMLTPEINIRLGSRYLKGLHDQFNGWLMLATPSYNAGPHRTKRWLPAKTVPADLWIEDIPFDETRLYIQRVLSYIALYEHRLEMKVTRLRDRMPDVDKSLPGKKKPKQETSPEKTKNAFL